LIRKYSILYIGRHKKVHDFRFVEALLEVFEVQEIYTQELESKSLRVDMFLNIDLIIAGPLTDVISAIPPEINVPILGISHAFDLNIEYEDYPVLGNIERCEAIVSDCNHITKKLRNTYQYAKSIFEIPWGCDREYFSMTQIEFERKPKILVTRNWFPIYRNDLVLSALKMLDLKAIDFSCTFVGTGPLLEYHSRDFATISKTSSIRFLGYQDQKRIRDEMSDNWIYISAASSDGTSVSLLEAMAAGMICIVTDFPSNQEWIENSINGFTFPNGDHKALSLLIEKVSSLTLDEKIKISRAAKEVIARRGDWKENRKIFTSVVQTML